MLSASYAPLGVISWMKAVSLLWQEKVEVLAGQDRVISSPSIRFEAPSVVRLNRMVRHREKSVKLTRRHLFFRDGFTCQYCGARLPARKLNVDHVIPRRQGGGTVWDNLVTACIRDNIRKGGRTPQQAGMTLLRAPKEPRWGPAERILATLGRVPSRWQEFLGNPRTPLEAYEEPG